MYLGSWKIDDLLTFAANTHAPTTGAAADADDVPAYRVYEDETGTAILNGSMAKLDDGNTIGFYSEQITLSAANGFEVGKTYTIYITATVGGVAGTMSHTFQMQAEVRIASYGTGLSPLQPTVAGRSLNVAATGEADTNLIAWQGETPNALISGRVDASVGANIVEEARVDGAITQAGQTTAFTTNLSETEDNKYAGWRFVYTGVGANSAVTRIVEAYDGTTKAVTLNRALPTTATLGHSFVLWSDDVLTQAGANAAADTALSDIHLDHLLATTYDPASKPGAADALLNELVGNDGGVSQFTANALELAPGGGNGTIGAIEFTYTVDDGSIPIAGATVWISTDSDGNNAIFSGVTDAFGVLRNPATSAKPFLDPGTYYFWVQAEGYSFSNPDTEVVS